MIVKSALVFLAGFSAIASAAPACTRRSADLSAQQILAISPNSASCSGAPSQDECRTADVAAPNIATSFKTYGISSANEQAALLSLMLFESGDFKYNINHFPGRPGQGTRAMLMDTKALATSLYGADKVNAAYSNAAAQGTNASLNAVRELVLNDKDSFASAAWFTSTHCTPAQRQGLQSGTQSGWLSWLTQCIGTSDPDGSRQKIWSAAIKVLSGQ